MRKDDLNVHAKTETVVAQNLFEDFFSNFNCRRTFPYEGFYVKKNIGVRG